MTKFSKLAREISQVDTEKSSLVILARSASHASLAEEIVLAQIHTTDILINILITTTAKYNLINSDNKLHNEVLAVAFSLARSSDSQQVFSEGHWRKTQIDADSILLSIQRTHGAVLTANSILNILQHIHSENTHQIESIEIPSLDKFVAALKVGHGEAFLCGVESNIARVIDNLSISAKKQRKEIGGLVSVLSFSKSINQLHKDLSHYLIQCLAAFQAPTASQDVGYIARKSDSALFLLFELMDKLAIASLAEIISPIVNELISKRIQGPMFSRAVRLSFLKGVDLFQRQPSLQGLIRLTETDDAAGFLVIQQLLCTNTKTNFHSGEESVLTNLIKITSKGLLVLARDLRRTVPLELTASKVSFDECISWLSLTPDTKHDQQTSLAKCLLLHYANCLGPRLILWLNQNHYRLGMPPKDVATLSALAGFDVPFILEANKRLYSNGLRNAITAPSKCNNIIDFMQLSLNEWKKKDKSVKQVDTIAKKPLVTVIFTTFKPNLQLFQLSLESILMQTHRAIEVIIIDDCSPSESSELLEALIANIAANHESSFVYKRNSSNVGQYVSRNTAIAMAKGEFIAIQDDDDISHPERLQTQISPMLTNFSIMATHANHIRISENARIMSDGDALGDIMGDAPISFIWRKQVFREIGYFLPTKTRGDIEFRTRMLHHYGAKAMHVLSQPLVIMRGGMGTVSADKEYCYRSALSALRYVMTHIPIGVDDADDAKRWIPILLQ